MKKYISAELVLTMLDSIGCDNDVISTSNPGTNPNQPIQPPVDWA